MDRCGARACRDLEHRTRKIVWSPVNVNAVCWFGDGKRVLTIVETSKQQRPSGAIPTTVLQSEIQYSLEERLWPTLSLVSSCDLRPPTGWILDVIPLPSGSMACYVWSDQGEAGIEFVSISEAEFHQ